MTGGQTQAAAGESGFGFWLKQYRLEAGLTQRELAEKLEYCDYPVTVSTINKYELGHRRPEGRFLAYLEECLPVEFDDTEFLLKALATDYLQQLADSCDAAREEIRKKKGKK